MFGIRVLRIGTAVAIATAPEVRRSGGNLLSEIETLRESGRGHIARYLGDERRRQVAREGV